MSIEEKLDILRDFANTEHVCDDMNDCLACAAGGAINQLHADLDAELKQIQKKFNCV